MVGSTRCDDLLGVAGFELIIGDGGPVGSLNSFKNFNTNDGICYLGTFVDHVFGCDLDLVVGSEGLYFRRFTQNFTKRCAQIISRNILVEADDEAPSSREIQTRIQSADEDAEHAGDHDADRKDVHLFPQADKIDFRVLESIDGVFVSDGDVHVAVEHPFKAKTCDEDG